MADATHIEWTDATWNPITGCSIVSPGCTHCYAMQLAGTRLQHHPSRKGLTVDSKAGPVWNGQVRFNAEWLDQPLRWKRPRKIFVCAHGDLFHESVPDDWIDQVFAVMAVSHRHIYQVLTKRPARMRAYLSDPDTPRRVWALVVGPTPGTTRGGLINETGAQYSGQEWPLPNVWLGVSAEDQTRADERIPILLDTPAAVRWVSLEPLLGPVKMKRWLPTCRQAYRAGTGEPFLAPHFYMIQCEHCGWVGSSELCSGQEDEVYCAACQRSICGDGPAGLDWVVLGGESGPRARPMHPDWARQVRDDCAAAGVPFLFKQWGTWAPGEACPNLKARDTASLFDGAWEYDRTPAARGDEHIDDEPDVYRIGKKAAGRLLDGQLHDGYPCSLDGEQR